MGGKRKSFRIARNLSIEVNLNGANLSGANLTGSRRVANLIETDSSQADSKQVIFPDDNRESGEEEINQVIQSTEKIASALDRAGVIFSSNCKMQVPTLEGRQNQDVNFIIFYRGKSGILQINGEGWHQNAAGKLEETLLKYSGISLVSYYSAVRCSEEAVMVVQEFLEVLSQA